MLGFISVISKDLKIQGIIANSLPENTKNHKMSQRLYYREFDKKRCNRKLKNEGIKKEKSHKKLSKETKMETKLFSY